MYIKTDRLLIEDFEPFEYPDFKEIIQDDTVSAGIGFKRPKTDADYFTVFDAYFKSPYFLSVKLAETSIGFIEFHKDYTRALPESLRIDYAIRKEYRGNGYMTEALQGVLKHLLFDENIPVISVGHYEDNTKSQSVILKCEFKLEGTIRRAKRLPDGSLVNVVNYSLVKEDFGV